MIFLTCLVRFTITENMKRTILTLSTVVALCAFGAGATSQPGTGNREMSQEWHTTFTGSDNNFAWPAGSSYGKSVNYKNTGTDSNPVFGVYSNTDPDDFDGFFITPKLKADAGDVLTIMARCNSAYSNSDGINVYISGTRDGLRNPETRTGILQLASASEDETKKLTTTVAEYDAVIPESGEYYIGFSSYNRGLLCGIQGLELADVPHDISILPGNMPATAIQNREAAGTFKILNLGIHDENASDYELTVDIDGELTTTPGETDIRMEHDLSAAGTEIPFSFRSYKVGSVCVSVSITFNDGYTICSEPTEITIVKETLDSEITVGAVDSSSSSVPLASMYDNSETIALYTPDMLGLNGGDKIKGISLKGYVKGNAVNTDSHLRLCYMWTDKTSIGKPEDTGAYDYSGMTVMHDGPFHWTEIGSENEPVPVLEFLFDESLVYEEGKSLLILIHNERDKYKSGVYFESSYSNSKTAWQQKSDNSGGQTGIFKGNWTAVEIPPIHITLDVHPRTLSGHVSGETPMVGNAVITLVSTDGDNIRYEGVSDSDGSYTVDVIQSSRRYDVTVNAGGYGEFADDLDFSDNSVQIDFNLRRIVNIHNGGTHTSGAGNAIVYMDKDMEEGFNMICLPVSMSDDEVMEIFGYNTEIYRYTFDAMVEGDIVVNFDRFHGDLAAGQPYLIYSQGETASAFWRSREVVDELTATSGNHVSIVPTSAATPRDPGMLQPWATQYPVSASQAQSREDIEIPAYSGYIVPLTENYGNVLISLDNKGIPSKVTEIDKEESSDRSGVYDLQGRPATENMKGIRIKGGRLVMIK